MRVQPRHRGGDALRAVMADWEERGKSERERSSYVRTKSEISPKFVAAGKAYFSRAHAQPRGGLKYLKVSLAAP